MEVRFTQAARKHRIGKGHALAAMHEAGEPTKIPASAGCSDDRLVFVGRDDRGVELEVIAVAMPDYLLVLHVMPTLYRMPTHDRRQS